MIKPELKKKNLNNFPYFIKFLNISSKSLKILKNKNIYTFITDTSLKKNQIKYIFETLFLIKIKKIRSLKIYNNSLKKFYLYLN